MQLPSQLNEKFEQKPWFWSLTESNRTCFSVQAKLINTSFLELQLREQNIALKVRPRHREVALRSQFSQILLPVSAAIPAISELCYRIYYSDLCENVR